MILESGEGTPPFPLHSGDNDMKRLIGTGLSILVLSALSATAAKAAENRLEYQLHLTHHPAPAMTRSTTQMAPKVSSSMSTEKPQVKTEKPQSELQPVRSGNPYAQQARPST